MVTSKLPKPILLLLVTALLVIIYSLTYFLVYKPLDKRYSSFNTIPILNQSKISPGYTLIAPYNRFQTPQPWTAKIYLLDMLGNTVHTWSTEHQPLYAVLKENGNLLVAIEDPQLNVQVPPGGNTGIIQELDWNSKVVWEFKDKMLHHDLVPLKNGNVLVSLWEKTPEEVATLVQGGEVGTELNGTIFSDEIAEINPQGEKAWSWHSYEHLNPELDKIGQLLPRYGWTYTNGLKNLDKSPVDGEESLLLSMRSLNTIFIVNKKTGDITWRSPKEMFNVQHDPTLLDNGNILAFDNGLLRVPHPHPLYGSRVLEVDPKTNQIVWQFSGGDSVIDKVRFFAPLTSGAQRLKNGNTVITNGPKGHIFEVTSDGEIVWDFMSPYVTNSTGHFPNTFLFKSHRYQENEINWPQKLSPPINKSNLNLYNQLSKIYP